MPWVHHLALQPYGVGSWDERDNWDRLLIGWIKNKRIWEIHVTTNRYQAVRGKRHSALCYRQFERDKKSTNGQIRCSNSDRNFNDESHIKQSLTLTVLAVKSKSKRNILAIWRIQFPSISMILRFQWAQPQARISISVISVWNQSNAYKPCPIPN